ncbi:receptor protein kinase WSS1 [Lolium perenne]|uniref:receptor protein kinase WSS1 n=1 Tax=Lolium perenne TaxID=4522 RepID=UPI0021EA0250|nr:receptor-like kinase TMK4 [Lolium perenne]
MGRDLHPFSLAVLLLSSFAAAAAKSADEGAIFELANSLSNPPASWGSAGDVCIFDGITCEHAGSGRVTVINLRDKGLTGTLPTSMSSLTALKELHLQGNALHGDFPSLAGFTDLTRLVLDGNAFTSLPSDFLKDLPSLQYLSLEDLPLKPWAVPGAIVGSSSLETFSASNASIAGAFPAVLANLSSLKYLRLSYNSLTGGLPAGLAELIALETLQLNNQISDAKLSGSIDVVAAMTNLKLLWIQSNKFTGPIPDFSNSRLEAFNVRDNRLTGVVPPSLFEIRTLLNVSLTNNLFQGPMPNTHNVSVDLVGDTISRFCLSKPGPCDPLITTLLEVAAGFGYPAQLAETWNGNTPCGNWIGVICSNGNVSILDLHNRGLSGIISPSIANLTGVRRLDLSDNHLTGVVPDALTTMPNLIFLDVSNNTLNGELPKFKPSVKVLAEGNRFGESTGLENYFKLKSNVGMIIGVFIAVLLLITCVWLLVHYRRKKNTEKFGRVSTNGSPDESEMTKIQMVGTHRNSNRNTAVPTDYSQVSAGSTNIAYLFESHGMELPIEVLLKATDNFNEDCILGKGGFGVVFKGNLNGKLVAVKRCDSGTMGTKGQQEFMAEIDVLTKVRHRHLVGLLGYCTHGYERLLVYEYMSGGTLREHLCDLQRSGFTPLTWTQRMTIALDVARGIEYLHGLAQETFIHRDLKPSNILLDQDLRAKVSDFGLVKLANDTDKSMMTKVAGTFGYLAPEYATTGKVTTKVDVYAYGVILMEMITGRKVLDDSLPDEESHLVTIFRRNMLDKVKFRKFVDPTLELSAEAWKSLLEVSDLARHCTAREQNQRPDMCHCVNRLSSLLDQWKPTEVDDNDESEASEIGLNQQLEKWRCDDFTISDSDTFSTLNMSRKYNR